MSQRILRSKSAKINTVALTKVPVKRVTRSSSDLHNDSSVEQAQKKKRPTYETPEIISETLLCRVCFVQFKNQTRYRRHLIKIHEIKSQDIGKLFQSFFILFYLLIYFIVLHSPELAPDTKYPNTYCSFCDINHFKADRYRQHLIGLHGLDIEVAEEYDSLIDKTVKPDPHDPDYYCLICKTTSADKTDYCNHLKKEHNMKFKTGKSESR